jgi:predicted ATPase
VYTPTKVMKNFLKRVHVAGFKSIRDCTLELGALSVFIGANGAGKSNFISFFKMLNFISTEGFATYVGKYGASNLLHLGVKQTSTIHASLDYETEQGTNTYEVMFAHAPSGDRLIFTEEKVSFLRPEQAKPREHSLGAGHPESRLSLSDDQTARVIKNLLTRTRVYQFHDTSETARIKQTAYLSDDVYLKSDAGNLAAVLFRLKRDFPKHYRHIVQTIRLSAPYFQDFVLEPTGNTILLRYTEFDTDMTFGADQISDGTLRLMALLTLLLQPIEQMPNVIIIDEPELGLHPHALTVVLSVMQRVTLQRQIILATQSLWLVDAVDPSDIIVTERQNSETVFKRLDLEKLSVWLEEYSLGQLYESNHIGGRPSR